MSERAAITKTITPSRTRRGWYGSEIWHVWDSMSDSQPEIENIAGTVNPNLFYQNTFLPTYGQTGPLPFTLYTDLRVIQVIAPWSYLVLATYASFGLYSGGPRSISRAFNQTRYIELPIWNRFTDGVVVGWAQPEKRPHYPRMVALRVETRFVVGNSIGVIQNAIAANAGTLWLIDGLWYRLSDQCSASWDGLAYTRVDYAFERDCQVEAIPPDPGGTFYGNDNAIPFLPALYLWSERADAMSSANPPTVRAVPPPAVIGGQPNFPALPNFP
jgi:hypothetical protein